MEERKRVAIVDADGLIYHSCFNKKDAEELKTFEDCCKHLDNLFKNIFLNVKSTHYLAYLTIGKCFRYNLYDKYKDTPSRKMPKPPHFEEVRQYMIDVWKAIHHPDYEADDLALIAHRMISDSVIITVDKDLKHCVQGHFFDPQKNLFINNSLQEAEYNFWKSMIVGDNGDNIKGLKGKGKVFADELLSKGNYLNYSQLVYDAYLQRFGTYKGIDEFYVNYRLLKILEFVDNFEVNPVVCPEVTISDTSIDDSLLNIDFNL